MKHWTQLYKIGQPGLFLRKPLVPVLKTGLPLMENVFKPLAKCFLIPLGLTAATSATDVAVNKDVFRSAITSLIISNKGCGIWNKYWSVWINRNSLDSLICEFKDFDSLGVEHVPKNIKTVHKEQKYYSKYL